LARKRIERIERTERQVEIVPDLKMIFGPKNDEQKELLRTISESTITFVTGSPGSGKSTVSIGYSLTQLIREKYKQVIITRPIVEAGNGSDRIGLLPGELSEKVRVYFAPIFAIISKLVNEDTLKNLTKGNGNAKIITMPIAFMRGWSFENSIMIMDEAQNSTPEQVKLFLTRLGEGSKAILIGDENQSDISPDTNGLEDGISLLSGVNGISHIHLSDECIFRHPIIRDIERRYNARRQSMRKDTYP